MVEYHKIQTIYKRNPKDNYKSLLEGEFSLPEFEYLAENEWIYTEKVDGTNIRIIWEKEIDKLTNEEHFHLSIGGKTNKAQIPIFLYDKLQELFFGEEKRELFSEMFPDGGVTLFGEGYGAKIQKGGGNYIFDGVDFVLFDVLIGSWWLKREDVEEIASKLGIKVVPVIGRGTLYDMVELVRDGFNSQWGKFLAEGIVARPVVELKARNGKRIITKLKTKDFQKGN